MIVLQLKLIFQNRTYPVTTHVTSADVFGVKKLKTSIFPPLITDGTGLGVNQKFSWSTNNEAEDYFSKPKKILVAKP